MQQTKERGFLHGALQSHIWDTRIKSANVTKMERIFGYMLGPFGVMLLQSIVNSYFNQYLTDVRGFTVSKGDRRARLYGIQGTLDRVVHGRFSGRFKGH